MLLSTGLITSALDLAMASANICSQQAAVAHGTSKETSNHACITPPWDAACAFASDPYIQSPGRKDLDVQVRPYQDNPAAMHDAPNTSGSTDSLPAPCTYCLTKARVSEGSRSELQWP